MIPSAIHFLECQIMPMADNESRFDPNTRERIPRKRQPVVTINARPEFCVPGAEGTSQFKRIEAGKEEFRGVILFRTVDLLAAGYVPKSGDKLLKRKTKLWGDREENLFIENPLEYAHYDDGAELIECALMDRNPVQ